jgi:hypothetical protein
VFFYLFLVWFSLLFFTKFIMGFWACLSLFLVTA